MNKKFINLLLASVLTVGSAQVFTSCKDNEADFQKGVLYEYESLKARVDKNENDIRDLQGDLGDFKLTINRELQNTKDSLGKVIYKLDTTLVSKINGVQSALNDSIGNVHGWIKELDDSTKNSIQNLWIAINKNGGAIANLDTIHAKDIARVDSVLKEHDAQIATLNDSVSNFSTKIIKLQTDLTVVEALADSTKKALAALTDSVGNLGTIVDGLGEDLKALTDTVAGYGSRLATTEATLIEVQKTIEILVPDSVFQKYKALTDGRLDKLEAFKNNWEPILPVIQTTAFEALAQANINAANIEAVNGLIDELKEAHASNASLIRGLEMKISNILAQLENVATLDDLNAVSKYLQEKAYNYYEQSISYTNLMIEQVVALLNDKNKGFVTIKDFNEAMESVKGSIDEINNKTIPNLEKDIEDNKDAIEALKEELEPLNSRIEEVAGRITGIVIQGTDSPVFGSIRLPLGIQSNMLVAYSGFVANAEGVSKFPLVADDVDNVNYTYNREESNLLTTKEATNLGIEGFATTVAVPVEKIEGVIMNKASDKKSGLLGRVYATINPSNVDVDKFKFNLVNSRGQKIANELTFKPSDELLTFGYSRAASPNGFYSAEATIDTENEAALNSVRFHFNDNLKTTVKDILKAPRASANAQTVVKLAAAVYDQLNGFLPAIGVEASWNDTKSGNMTVTSNYAIATAVANPLSFRTLLEYKPGHHIPNLLPQIEKIQDKFEVIFDEFSNKLSIKLYKKPFEIKWEDKVWVSMPKLEISLDEADKMKNPVVDLNLTIDGEEVECKDIEINVAGEINATIENLVGKINGQLAEINTNLGGINDDLNGAIGGMINDISSQVDELLRDMQEEIDGTIKSVLDDIQSKVNGVFDNATLNRLIGRMDALINKLNTMMDNVNYYLQPALFYINGNNYGRLSSNYNMPSVMIANHSNSAITLVPTTLTYETVVPVYEKYVAVTKVWENEDQKKPYDQRQNKVSIAQEANGNTADNTNMNRVLNGSVRRVALKLEKGYTYEVFYQAIDFSGYVSGRKYYICVK